MEPQTIINKSYIQDLGRRRPPTYTTILAIAPSMTGTDLNGPGLSDGGVKNTLRGLPDGNFGINYDGIPFGDTNGPTHHSESYFPGHHHRQHRGRPRPRQCRQYGRRPPMAARSTCSPKC